MSMMMPPQGGPPQQGLDPRAILAALQQQQGGGAPQQQQGPDPGAIMAALQQQGGAQQQGPDPSAIMAALQQQGGPPQQDAPSDQQGGDAMLALRDLLGKARDCARYAEDDVEAHQIEKVTTLIAQLLAKRQQEEEGMLQGKMSPGSMRRAASSAYGG